MTEDAHNVVKRSLEKEAPLFYESTEDLLRTNLTPHTKATLIGPHSSTFYDATLLFLSLYAHNESLTVIEPIEYRGEQKRRGAKTVGEGGWQNYRDELILLQAKGLDLAIPRWGGVGVGVQNIQEAIGLETQEAIVDHNTSPFLVSFSGLPELTYDKIFEQYFQVLQPGGKVILAIQKGLIEHENVVKSLEAFVRQGFTTQQASVKYDAFDIPLSRAQLTAMQQDVSNKSLARAFFNRVENVRGVNPKMHLENMLTSHKVIIGYKPGK